ncbi:MAG: hypothetical protein QME60_01295 [Verrucomicrobiota bacterium]|nr:hypothetical protein [Verrucomicrobiota bacterium]
MGLWLILLLWAAGPQSAYANLGGAILASGGVGNFSVDSDKIATGAVNTEKVAADAITSAKLISFAVESNKIATGAVGTEKIAGNAVTRAKIDSFAVDSDKIDTGAVGTEKLASGAVTANKLLNAAVQTAKLALDSVDTDKLMDTSHRVQTLAVGTTIGAADRLTVGGNLSVTGGAGGTLALRAGSSPSNGVMARYLTNYAGISWYDTEANALSAGSTGRSMYSDGNSFNMGTSDRLAFTTSADGAGTRDAGISRVGVNTLGIGTGAAGSRAGHLQVFGVNADTIDSYLGVDLEFGYATPASSYLFCRTASCVLKDATIGGTSGLVVHRSTLTVTTNDGGSNLFDIRAQLGVTISTQVTIAGSSLTVSNIGGKNVASGGLGVETTMTVTGGSVTIQPTASAFAYLRLKGAVGNNANLALTNGDTTVSTELEHVTAAGAHQPGTKAHSLSIKANSSVVFSNDSGATTHLALVSGSLGIGAGTSGGNPGTKLHMSSGTLTVDGTSPAIVVGSNASDTLVQGSLIVYNGAAQTIAAGATITADACGGIKTINAGGNVTTDTTNTFTAPAAANRGCCMDVTNIDTVDTITLDTNANFNTAAGADVALTPCDVVRVCSDGTDWYQVAAAVANTCN